LATWIASCAVVNAAVQCGSLVIQLKAVNETSVLIQALGPERASASLYAALSMKDDPMIQDLLPFVLSSRKSVDQALDNLSSWLVDDADKHNPNMSSKAAFQASLLHQRSIANTTSGKDLFVDFYTDRNAHFVRWIATVINQSPDSALAWQNLTAYYLLIAAKEQFGIERGSGVYLFINGSMNQEVHLFHIGHRQQALGYLELIDHHTPVVKEELNKRLVGSQLEKDLASARAEMDSNESRERDRQAARKWIGDTTKHIELLQEIEIKLLDGIIKTLNDKCSKAN